MDSLQSFFKETTCAAKLSRENELFKGRNSLYPSLCAAVEVSFDEHRQRFVRAVVDIPVGKVICVDEGITFAFDDSCCQFCLTALKKAETKSCARCRVDKKCKLIRQTEDGATAQLAKHGMLEFCVRIVLSFPVEQIAAAVRKKDYGNPVSGFSSRSFSSIAFLSQADIEVPDIMQSFGKDLEPVLSKLDKHPEWSTVVERRKLFCDALRFVMMRVPSNAHSVILPDADPRISADYRQNLAEALEEVLWPTHDSSRKKREAKYRCSTGKETEAPVGVGFFPIASIVNHSCKPNTFSYFHENRMIFVSKGIRAGQEVTDSYGPAVFTHTYEERQEMLQGRGFSCTCSECRLEREEMKEGGRREQMLSKAKEDDLDGYLNAIADRPSFSSSLRLLNQIERLLPSFDVSLAHSYRIVILTAAQEGKLSESCSLLSRYRRVYTRMQSSFDIVTASISHSFAVVLFACYQRSADREMLIRAQTEAFRAINQYTLLFGRHGVLTRAIMHFIKDHEDLING